MDELVVAPRFCGPPTSGNGGYTCGLVAAFVDAPAEITLRAPPPLGRPLGVARERDLVRVLDGDILVAEGRPVEVRLDVPDPPSLADAEEATARYPGFERHPFATCFVCGPSREADDGLRIFASPLAGRNLVASPWTPDDDLASADGGVRPEFVWAALDCPGGFAVGYPDDTLLLGRLAARIDRLPRPGEPLVVAGWPLGSEGRKRFAGTALYADGGEIVARARATWFVMATSEPAE